ncbi:MAG: hypothetical protein BWY54_00223 [Candidatus Dependentiae bacterium ADurb.Bin331]|nr:MAG: hypothetical protein BWY54_00223 [Candidatus Dependentiae bacterium ADurb.Bin331]
MKIVPILLSFVASVSIFAHNSPVNFSSQLKPTIQDSIWSQKNPLSNEEIQLLANTVYFSLMRAKIEQQIEQQLTLIAHTALQLKIVDKQVIDLAQPLSDFEYLVHTLKNNVNMRNTITLVHEELMEKALQDQRLFTLIDAMATHATEAITVNAQLCSADTQKTLKAIQPIYTALSQQFQIYDNTCEALTINNNPFLIEEQMRGLALYDTIETMVDAVDAKVEELHESSKTLSRQISQLQNNGIEIFELYYHIIFQGMVERSFEPFYFEIMASSNLKESLMLNYLPKK